MASALYSFRCLSVAVLQQLHLAQALSTLCPHVLQSGAACSVGLPPAKPRPSSPCCGVALSLSGDRQQTDDTVAKTKHIAERIWRIWSLLGEADQGNPARKPNESKSTFHSSSPPRQRGRLTTANLPLRRRPVVLTYLPGRHDSGDIVAAFVCEAWTRLASAAHREATRAPGSSSIRRLRSPAPSASGSTRALAGRGPRVTERGFDGAGSVQSTASRTRPRPTPQAPAELRRRRLR